MSGYLVNIEKCSWVQLHLLVVSLAVGVEVEAELKFSAHRL